MKFQKIIAHILMSSFLFSIMLPTVSFALGSAATDFQNAFNTGAAASGFNIGAQSNGFNTGAPSSGDAGKLSNPLGPSNTSLAALLQKILQVVIMLGAIVVVFFYIYAGFKFVVARGDEGAIKQATLTLTWTTVGAFVVLGAQVISAAIQGTVQQLNLGK